MKGFIEVHTDDGKCHLVNIRHIVEVVDNKIYTDETPRFAADYPCFECWEGYEEIRDKIERATE